MKRKPEPARMAEIHKIQERIHEETKHMSIREKVAYYRRARKELGLTTLAPRQKRRTA
jgi:hypothetical protein